MLRRPLHSYALTALLFLSDTVGFLLLWRVAHLTREWLNPYFPNPINAFYPNYTHTLVPYLAMWWAILSIYGHYSHHRRISSLNELRRMLQSSSTLFLAMPALAWFLKEYSLGRSVVLLAWLYFSLYLYVSRTLLRMVKRSLVRRGYNLSKVIIFGAGETGRQVAESILNHPEVGYRLIGFVDDGRAKGEATVEGAPVLGDRMALIEIARSRGVDEVFLARPDLAKDDLLNLVVELEEAHVTVKTVANVMEVITGEFQDEEIADFPVMNLRDGHLRPTQSFAKRALDLTVTLLAAPVWAPLWAGLALYLLITQGRPIHFAHERVGRDGVLFKLYKFRTMRTDAPPQAPAPTDAMDPRVTPAGRWLRRTSLDELPQLINVLRGDMSLVGPRPEMPFIVDQYEEWQRRRLDVFPGITGLWQVIGRKNLPLAYNLEYDFYYIRNQSLWLDLSILARTLPAVIFGRGAF